MKRLVLAGGGHSHVEVLRRFGRQPLAAAEVVLVSPDRFTAYSGMLPGLVAGHYTFEQAHIDLEALCRFARARFVQEAVIGIDPQRRALRCAEGAEVPYDLVSIDIGSAPTRDAAGTSADAGVPVKPTGPFLEWWAQAVAEAGRRALHIVTIGGGAGGVEVTLAMHHHLSQPGFQPARFSVLTLGDTVLAGHPAGVRRRVQRALAERGIEVRLHSEVAEVRAGRVRLRSGEQIDADHVVWAIGPKAQPWPGAAGLATDPRGFMLVDETLRSVSHPEIYAAGDIATMRGHPRPKSGVYAVRQGPPLAENLRRALNGEKLARYLPQPVALALISTGNRYAIASWGPFAWQGAWVWRWKDRIDRRFMQRYVV